MGIQNNLWRELFQQTIEGLEKISILGCIPIIPLSIVVSGAVIFSIWNPDTITPIERLTVEKGSLKEQKMLTNAMKISDTILNCSAMLIILCVLFCMNVICDSFMLSMMNNISLVVESVLGLTGIVMTIAVAIGVFDKKYYLVFSIREVLQHYKVCEAMLLSIESCISTIILSITFLDNMIDSAAEMIRLLLLEMSVCCNIISITYLSWVMIVIMFSDTKKELKILNNLHRNFASCQKIELEDSEQKKWTENTISDNLNYLIMKYNDALEKIDFSEIEEIEFSTTLGCYRQKWQSKAIRRFIKTILWCFAASSLINFVLLGNQAVGLMLFNGILVLVAVVCCFVKWSSLQLSILNTTYGAWGHYIRKRNRKELWIRKNPLIENKYHKFFFSIYNLNAFMCILLNIKKNDNNFIDTAFNRIYKGIIYNKNIKEIVSLPLFIIGYFLFQQQIQKNELKNLYRDFELDENELKRFEKTVKAELFMLESKRYVDLTEVQDRIEKYVDWVKETVY